MIQRGLGLLAVLGGGVLLAAFVIDIGPGANTVRILLFELGAMAAAIGTYRIQARAAPTWALLGAAPVLLANAAAAAWFVLDVVGFNPVGSSFGLIGFYIALAMWLGDAWFGSVTFRLGVIGRWGGLALMIGSVLTVTGIDRLGLTSSQDPTIFGPLSLAGIALNGVGWIILGVVLIWGTSSRHEEALGPLSA